MQLPTFGDGKVLAESHIPIEGAGPAQTSLLHVPEGSHCWLCERSFGEEIHTLVREIHSCASAGTIGREAGEYESTILPDSSLGPVAACAQSRSDRERTSALCGHGADELPATHDSADESIRSRQSWKLPDVGSNETVGMIEVRRTAIKLMAQWIIPGQRRG